MPSWRLVFLSLSQTSILGSIPSGGTKNTYTTMTNAPENPQATRLSTTQPSNIADVFSTPRELCMNCYYWLTPEDDLQHCIENSYDCRAYLLGTHDNCPKHLVL